MARKNIKNQANQNFYMLHKSLFFNEKYKKLSDSAKVTYAILNDRVSLSIKNDWVDKNGDIFFIFTNENLQEVLDKSKNTITKIKKELQEIGLLEQVKTGFNRPNKLYLHEIETNISIEKEIQNNTLRTNETSDDMESQKMGAQNPKKWDSIHPKNGSPKSQNLLSNYTELNKTDYIKNNSNDMNDLNDTYNAIITDKIHSYRPNHFSHTWNDQDDKEILLQNFPEDLRNYLLNFSYHDLEIIKPIILKAKESFNSKHDEAFYMLEQIDHEILVALKRFKKALRDRSVKGQNETVTSMQGYLMRTILSELEEMHSAHMRSKNMDNIFNQ